MPVPVYLEDIHVLNATNKRPHSACLYTVVSLLLHGTFFNKQTQPTTVYNLYKIYLKHALDIQITNDKTC